MNIYRALAFTVVIVMVVRAVLGRRRKRAEAGTWAAANDSR